MGAALKPQDLTHLDLKQGTLLISDTSQKAVFISSEVIAKGSPVILTLAVDLH